MNSELYSSLNSSWKTTCKILFGEEIGELKDYEEWLMEDLPKFGRRISSSGKEIMLANNSYSENSRFVSAEEAKEKLFEPLTINQIKDIDSIAEVVSERWEYAGNKVLGNSSFVESSDMIFDSHNILNSANIQQCSNLFHSSLSRLGCKNGFGCVFFGMSEFIIKSHVNYNVKRTFGSYFIVDSSDVYLSNHCTGCNEVLFSFFQRAKRYCIGNLQLPKEKYFDLKKKLISEIRDELKKSRRFPALYELVPNIKSKELIEIEDEDLIIDKDQIEKGFSSTFKAIFKKEPENIDKYEKMLTKNGMKIYPVNSAFGGRTYDAKSTEFSFFSKFPKNRLVSQREGLKLGERHLSESETGSVKKIIDSLEKIGYFTVELFGGNNENFIDCPLVFYASNIYKTYDTTRGKYTGMTCQALDSSYIFGGNRLVNSEFCINSYNSMYLNRCFEVDTSRKCSDCMFCHNCEGLSECMFCFNLKGKRYAIGNSLLEKSQYLKIKESLIEQMSDEILENKDLSIDIFNIGGKRLKLWHRKLMNY